ncbi:MAG: putative Histidinol-phosphate aminotransferase [Promethearchaeota archaeon]|nr:MAG: putative Histidinol-phosphate aminotransferase [Candidatus Lokiarchaeota archaeon]
MKSQNQIITPSDKVKKMKPYFNEQDSEEKIDQLSQKNKFIKLDSNENPFGPPSALKLNTSILNNINRYPDPLSTEFLDVLAERLKISPESLLAGSGSDELLDLILRCYTERGESVLSFTPGFSMYKVYAQINEIDYLSIPMILKKNSVSCTAEYEIPQEKFLRKASQSKIIILARPNNPDGSVPREDFIKKVLNLKKLVILDEAYIEFSETRSLYNLTQTYSNLIVLRTLSKAYGLAGLRLGYGVMDPNLKRNLMVIKSPYNVNTVASEAGVIAIKSKKEIESNVRKIIDNRAFLFRELQKINRRGPYFFIHKSYGNFLLIRFNSPRTSWSLYKYLLTKSIKIRSFKGEMLNSCLRVSIGRRDELKKIISEIKNFFEED